MKLESDQTFRYNCQFTGIQWTEEHVRMLSGDGISQTQSEKFDKTSKHNSSTISCKRKKESDESET